MVYPDDEHLFVVRPVEDPDLPPIRQPFLVAAQEILVELGRRRDLEALHPHALRVDAAHDVTDRPILARGIECLQDDEDAVGVLRSESRLVIRKELDPLVQQRDPVLLPLDPRLECGIEVLGQVHAGAWADSERLDEPRDSLRRVVGHLSTFAPADLARIGESTEPVRKSPRQAEVLALEIQRHGFTNEVLRSRGAPRTRRTPVSGAHPWSGAPIASWPATRCPGGGTT